MPREAPTPHASGSQPAVARAVQVCLDEAYDMFGYESAQPMFVHMHCNSSPTVPRSENTSEAARSRCGEAAPVGSLSAPVLQRLPTDADAAAETQPLE